MGPTFLNPKMCEVCLEAMHVCNDIFESFIVGYILQYSSFCDVDKQAVAMVLLLCLFCMLL